MIQIKVQKPAAAVDWTTFFSERGFSFMGETTGDGVNYLMLSISETPTAEEKTKIAAAITAIIQKVYWSDDPLCEAAFNC